MLLRINGTVIERSKETINSDLKTGEIEINIVSFEILGFVKNYQCPFLVTKNMQKK